MNTDELVLKRLSADHLDKLITAQNDIFSDYVIPIRSSREFFVEFMRSVGGRMGDIIVAHQGDDIVGYVNPVLDGRQVWIGGLGVVPRMRRDGVGTKLMEAAEEFAESMGADEVILEVIEANTAARRLYEGLGYEPQATYLSAEGKAAQFAGFGPTPDKAQLDEVEGIHARSYKDSCWQRRKRAALAESARTCEIYKSEGGFVMLRRVSSTGFIPFLGVDPSLRRNGVGTWLAKFALNRLWELGAFKVAMYNVNDDEATRRMLDMFDFAVTLKQLEMRKELRQGV
ncbi:TPA: GNAT family N-acetyltransferase [Thermoplasmata archaeon]|nr:GNAT family N-acetyltransferase [Thermoplasmata archaeon]